MHQPRFEEAQIVVDPIHQSSKIEPHHASPTSESEHKLMMRTN
jgi:hypothetical protein